LLPLATRVIHPYIYSPAEVRAILQAARRLSPAGSLRPATYATLIGLLAVSGLRLGEALRLDLADVDLHAELLSVRASKFRKSRLVPITTSAATALSDYLLQRRRAGCAEHPAAPLFVTQHGSRCHGDTVDDMYRKLLLRLPLITAQGRTPRLHDFRHTFATTCAAHIASDAMPGAAGAGTDPTAGLAGLATYLGHSNFAHTQRYLHPQGPALETASARFRQHTLDAISSRGPDAAL
jgi:integrase